MIRYCSTCIYCKQDVGMTKEKGIQYKCKLSYTQGYMSFLDNNDMGYVCEDRKEN